jgi:hypothetical protein
MQLCILPVTLPTRLRLIYYEYMCNTTPRYCYHAKPLLRYPIPSCDRGNKESKLRQDLACIFFYFRLTQCVIVESSSVDHVDARKKVSTVFHRSLKKAVGSSRGGLIWDQPPVDGYTLLRMLHFHPFLHVLVVGEQGR